MTPVLTFTNTLHNRNHPLNVSASDGRAGVVKVIDSLRQGREP